MDHAKIKRQLRACSSMARPSNDAWLPSRSLPTSTSCATQQLLSDQPVLSGAGACQDTLVSSACGTWTLSQPAVKTAPHWGWIGSGDGSVLPDWLKKSPPNQARSTYARVGQQDFGNKPAIHSKYAKKTRIYARIYFCHRLRQAQP